MKGLKDDDSDTDEKVESCSFFIICRHAIELFYTIRKLEKT